MAKSLRSKVKRSFRSKKRESGVYAAAEAGRLNRLNTKLIQVQKASDGDVPIGEAEGDEEIPAQGPDDSLQDQPDSMSIDTQKPHQVSTHGPRGSRREEWRKSKGMPARATSLGMNRQGGIAAKRKAGRSKRRR
ncbi:hypothetical protein GALMADRAFT_634884 [Galerina marginata CBS 339.88]|uniref:DUF2423 domain-containing protein n=1 Tax=Galerina marginata (strain CBS 339.88) TaxID=685588 RepID=A0A067TTW0_GALM3|nr:hypothetical protein GALMADRAFT_634884 [Galerina marginata CBS 339.88]